MQMTTEQVEQLEKEAEANDGHCGTCGQTIKIYRYRINRVHALFMRAMAQAVRDSGVNDVDVGTIGLAYSVRSQNTKLRQHGLIARVKNDKGAHIPRRWLITHKGWHFLNHGPIPSKVVVFNNQVLGHSGPDVNIHQVLGEAFHEAAPLYDEIAVSEPEARVLEDVRTPQKAMFVQAQFKGRSYLGQFKVSQVYELQIKRLQAGKPIEIVGVDGKPVVKSYPDLAAYQRDWKML